MKEVKWIKIKIKIKTIRKKIGWINYFDVYLGFILFIFSCV